MRRHVLLTFAFLLTVPVFAQMHHGTPAAKPATMPMPLETGLGPMHHPVTTSSAEAQKYFDQGLNLLYGFNHDEALKSFQQAAKLDPNLAMAYWGVAYAAGPNYNLPIDWDREKISYDAITKAQSLAEKVSPSERAYIAALTKRFTNDKNADLHQLDVDYADAMRDVMKNYPDDLDAATLFAEAMMGLRPWKLWNPDGTPAPGTDEIVSTLESVLRRNPNHLGAMHFYIHAVEASPSPERALAYADHLGALAPASGHLVHMPAHTYIRTGDFDAAAAANEKAAKADEAYIQRAHLQGIYPLMYYSHNLHFLASVYSSDGRLADALRSAQRLEHNVSPHVKDVPMLEGFMPTRYWVLARFHRWDEILALPAPPAGRAFQAMMWHYARGMAMANKGNVAGADKEHTALLESARPVPRDMVVSPVKNTAGMVIDVADKVLAAQIVQARDGAEKSLPAWQEAVAVYDKVGYAEPPDWYYSVRESLGAALLQAKQYAEAEQVFRQDLVSNRRNGRSLYGLALALKGQGKDYDSGFVMQEYKAAWSKAEKPLAEGDL
jgi:tetratricopeptide (TPR) repeat protein